MRFFEAAIDHWVLTASVFVAVTSLACVAAGEWVGLRVALSVEGQVLIWAAIDGYPRRHRPPTTRPMPAYAQPDLAEWVPGPLDREAARDALLTLYWAAGLSRPTILWARSPREAQLFEAVLVAGLDSSSELVRTAAATWNEALAQLPPTGECSSPTSVIPELALALGWLSPRAVVSRLLADTPLHSISTPADRELGTIVAFQIEQELGVASDWPFGLARRTYRPARSPAIGSQSVKHAALVRLSKACGGFRPLDGVAILIEPPVEINETGDRYRQDGGFLHNLTGPAVRYSDGFSAWAVHGAAVAWAVVEEPGSLDVRSIRNLPLVARRPVIEHRGRERYLQEAAASADLVASEPDQQLARELLSRYGAPRFVEESGTVIASDFDSQGLPRRLWRASRTSDEPIVLLEVVNSTPESDGSRHTYWLRVPPGVTTCRAAVAWTFGMNADEYVPLAEA